MAKIEKAKLGRPFRVKGEPRNVTRSLKMTEKEAALLEELTKIQSKSRTEVIIDLLMREAKSCCLL